MTTNVSDKKNYGKQFFSGVAILAVSTFIVKVIGMFYKIPMMAYLGAEGMGYFNSAYDIYSLLFVISTTGLPVAISILVSKNKSQNRFDNIKKIYRISITLLGALGLVGTLLLAIFHKNIASMINNNAAALSILTISPTLFLICLTSAIRGYFQGNQLMLPTAVSQVIEALGKLALGLGFAIIAINQGYDVPTVASLAVLGVTIGVALSLLYLSLYKLFYKASKRELDCDTKLESTNSIVKNLVSIAVPITISSSILSLSKIIDMTMILRRLNDIGYTQSQANSVYGAYSTMAISIYNLPATFITAIALPLIPMLTSAIECKDKAKEHNVVLTSLKLTSIISLPIGLGISVFSKPLLELLFASQKSEVEYVAPLLSLLGISVFASSMITITNAILQAYKQVQKPIIAMIVGTLVKIISAYLLIGTQNINVYGAPISSLFSVTTIVAINLYYIIRETGKIKSVYSLFVKPFIAATLSIILGLGFYLLVNSVLESRLVIVITIVFVAFSYLLLALKLRAIDENEVLMLPKGERILKILRKAHFM